MPQNERSGPDTRLSQKSTIDSASTLSSLDLVRRCFASTCRTQDFLEAGNRADAFETLTYIGDDLEDAAALLAKEES